MLIFSSTLINQMGNNKPFLGNNHQEHGCVKKLNSTSFIRNTFYAKVLNYIGVDK